MKRVLCTIASIGSLCALTTLAEAGPVTLTMGSWGSSAPNVFGSPSWSGYLANALAGIDAGGAATGTPGLPTYYASGNVFGPGDFVVTPFPSWKGAINPAAPFNDELGNRWHDGLRIEETGAQFSLSNLFFDMHSTDALDRLAFSGDFIGSTYSATLVGIDYGGDGIRGTADDVTYNSGEAGTNKVNLLLYVGIGNAFEADDPSEMSGLLHYISTNGGLPGPFSVTNTYTLKNDAGDVLGSTSATGTIAPVPEPATLVLLGSGLLGTAATFLKRRRMAMG